MSMLNRKMYKLGTLFSMLLGLFAPLANAQTFSDGPMDLQVRVRDVRVNHSEDDGAGPLAFETEFRMDIYGRDRGNVDMADWLGKTHLQQDAFPTPPATSMDFNTVFASWNYTGAAVPQFFDIRINAWEDDCPSDIIDFIGALPCNTEDTLFDSGCCLATLPFGANCNPININIFSPDFNPNGCPAYGDDDENCDSNPFQNAMNYRAGPPCQWYNHGYVSNPATCAGNKYEPRIESYWRYTRGDACTNAIQLGALTPGFAPITHDNANNCYTDNIAYAGGGQDVVYEVV